MESAAPDRTSDGGSLGRQRFAVGRRVADDPLPLPSASPSPSPSDARGESHPGTNEPTANETNEESASEGTSGDGGTNASADGSRLRAAGAGPVVVPPPAPSAVRTGPGPDPPHGSGSGSGSGDGAPPAPKKISLWLMTPEPLATSLASIQSDLVEAHAADDVDDDRRRRRLPRFPPHVTLIGGVPLADLAPTADDERSRRDPRGDVENDDADDDADDEAAARTVLERLRRAFRSHGVVECAFDEERGVFAARTPPDGDGDGEGEAKWNQSCVAVVRRGASFMGALRVAEAALFGTERGGGGGEGEPVERHFKPPLREPHYSFAYGNDADRIPDSLKCPPSFASSELSVWWTHPPTLEGVDAWREIGTVSLI